ncbi:MAG TPA: glycosyltransferase [Terriglobales bacterium]
MKLVIFGLTISSSWGNGHATLWRGLCKELGRDGHEVTFFEHDVPYYARHRDLTSAPDYQLLLYSDWSAIFQQAQGAVHEADAAIVTSYCPDGRAASQLVLDSPAIKVFYDLDTAVTLEKFRREGSVDYLPEQGLGGFDLVLSYVGGRALSDLRTLLGAKRTAPLYGSVDPDVHKPVPKSSQYDADLSYLGTYASDRQQTLEELLLNPARHLPGKKFLVGGAQYPEDFPWNENVWFIPHVPPSEHAAFYSSSRATLNVTRAAMAGVGYCPSGRLFEAAACETPIVSDWWEGLDQFFEPGRELLVAKQSSDVIDALSHSQEELRRIGRAARERALDAHTARHRSQELLNCIGAAA